MTCRRQRVTINIRNPVVRFEHNPPDSQVAQLSQDLRAFGFEGEPLPRKEQQRLRGETIAKPILRIWQYVHKQASISLLPISNKAPK
jgi:hypothetical protein